MTKSNTKQLKVFVMGNGRQYRMVAAPSAAQAMLALNVSRYEFARFASETGNKDDIAVATADPGVVFTKPSNGGRGAAWSSRLGMDAEQAADFRAFRARLLSVTASCRVDMHEPDEQDVSAVVVGNKLDNAFGEATDLEFVKEYVVIIRKGQREEKFNLATLIALARQARI